MNTNTNKQITLKQFVAQANPIPDGNLHDGPGENQDYSRQYLIFSLIYFGCSVRRAVAAL